MTSGDLTGAAAKPGNLSAGDSAGAPGSTPGAENGKTDQPKPKEPTPVISHPLCPSCGHDKCPAVNGSVKMRFGIKRSRRCAKCSRTFATMARWAPGSVTVTERERLA